VPVIVRSASVKLREAMARIRRSAIYISALTLYILYRVHGVHWSFESCMRIIMFVRCHALGAEAILTRTMASFEY